MNENQFTPETGNQQNQSLQDKLTGDQTQPGNYRGEDSEDRDRNTQQEFPERTQQHDYKNPTATQFEDDDEDDADTDGQIFEQDEEDEDADPVDEQSSGLRDTDRM